MNDAKIGGIDRINSIPGGVLLTGARGFLGAHLLIDVLRSSEARVTCLIRASGAEAARQALHERLTWYFGDAVWSPYRGRLRVLPGDIEKPRLGLEEGIYRELLAQPTVILNAAADVRQAGPASRFIRANTDSVASLIEFATTLAPKELHHVSTTSVRGHFPGSRHVGVFDESQLEQGQQFSNGYGESKYRAEVLLRRAVAANGLSSAVYRVGYIGPHAESGRFQYNGEDHALSQYVRACVREGLAPYLPESKFRITPVDCVARAILTLAGSACAAGKTYHVDSPHLLSQYDVIRVLHAAGYPIRLMEAKEFSAKIRELCSSADSIDILSPEPHDSGASTPALDSSFSHGELERCGFGYPKPSSAWLGSYIQHAIDVGFIHEPKHWRSAAPVAQLL